MRTITLPRALLIVALSGLPILSVAVEDEVLQVQDYQGIPYITGGVGVDERDYLQSVAKDFNLKLMFAAKEGSYLSNVNVQIRDSHHRTVLDTVAEGPFLYVNLPSGAYTISVDGSGRSFKRSVNLTRGKRVALDFYW